MTDNQTLRALLIERPRLTVEELSDALSWPEDKVRNVINGILHRGEGRSVPKRYELTELGERRTRQGGRVVLSEDERRERLRRRYLEGKAKAKVVERDGMVAKAIAKRDLLDMAWGGAA